MNQFFMAKKSLPSGDRITGKKIRAVSRMAEMKSLFKTERVIS